MIKLLVNAPTGAQEIIEISETGSYFEPDRVLWDERVDGPLPEDVTPGGLVRLVDEEGAVSLVHDDARLLEHQAAIAPSETELIKRYDGIVQRRLDDAAQAFGYGDPNRPEISPILHVISYADEPAVRKFQAEGRLFRACRSKTWAYAAAMLNAVKAGERPQPTEAELLAELDANVPLPTAADVDAEIVALEGGEA